MDLNVLLEAVEALSTDKKFVVVGYAVVAVELKITFSSAFVDATMTTDQMGPILCGRSARAGQNCWR